MVYDSVHHQVVLFGGYTSVVNNDTWLWDGANWTQASPATRPPARAGHAMAYDSVRQQVVLFGGYNSNFADTGDTWVWDGTTWAQKSPATSPTGRESHSMMFDAARSQVVLFGGLVNSTDSNETWTWDGTTWTQRAIGNGPSPRSQAGFVYDSTHSIGVLYGGRPSEGGLSDTWVWGGTSWSQRTPAASPGTRSSAGMVYDSARGLVVLFGGQDSSNDGVPSSDTWYYDNTNWTLATTQNSPSARTSPAMAYDALNAQSVLFSGQSTNNSTWLLSALTVLPKTLPDATQGTNYSVTYSADGGVTPYTFSVTGLPPGLSVNSSNQITGLCTGQSSTGVTISVTDSASPVSNASVGPLPLHCNPAPVITNTSPLPAGTTGVAYSVQFTTNAVYDAPGAAPFTWTLTPGTLPSGFALDATGVLTGITNTPQTSNFSVRFTDRWGATTLKAFQVSFYAPLTVTNSSLPSGTAGTAYTATTLTASGGSGGYTFSVTGLPTGLAVTGTTQAITGTPTQTGSFNPVITVTDSAAETAQRTLPLTIAASAPISITTAAALPAGHSGQAYSTTIAWTGGFAPYTVTGSGLPSWLTVSNAGVLSGTPPAGGSFTFSITVHDLQSPTQNTATKSFTLNVTAPVITTTSPLPSATVGVFYSDTFASSGGVAPYNYLASGLPAWLSMSSGGVLSGTPPNGTMSPVTFNVQVTDSANSTSSGSFSLPIITPASLMFVTTSPLPAATVGTAYSTTFAVTGGVSPYNYRASGLPSWLSLSSGGALSGTPPSPGSVTFQVTVSDSASNTLSSNFTLPVNAVLTIGTTSPLPAATVGVAYTQNLSASGGSGGYQWTGTGLPAWLSVSSAGVLSGTPPTATPVSFSVTVTDSSSSTVSKTLSLPVDSALTIGSASPLPAATLNAPYMYTFTASGGGGGYSWSGSGLPSGFTVSSGGVLTGTPTSTATLSFTINVLDSLNNSVSKAFSLPVNGAVTITNTSPLAPATVGVAYAANFTASGGSGGYSWSATGLPTWLSLTSAGYFSGTPPSPGNVSFTATVTDSQSHTATGTFTLPVNAALTIGTTSPLSAATVGAYYSLQLAASGGSGTYSWTSTVLPAWLTLTSGGLLSGTPPSAATVNFTATVTDTLSNTASRSFTLPVNSAVTISTTSPLPAATVSVAYTAQFAASGGTNSYSWTASSLPAWLSLSSGGLLSGTPPAPGTVTFTATATDTQSRSATGTFMLPVDATLTIGTTSPLARAVVGTAYSLQFAAAGGASPYSWAATNLPQWLTITSGGLLTGTPPTAASATFGVIVTDALSNTARGTFTLPVDAALAISSTSPLPTATIGISYSFQFAASGGSGSYTWSASSLPAWVTFTSAGMLSGTPPAGAAGSTFPVTVGDPDGQTRTANFTLPINAALTITTSSPLPAGTVGVPYTAQFTASGGSGIYSWSGSSLPTWLTVSSGGALSGTPPSPGTVTFNVTAIDLRLQQSVSKSFSLTSNAAVTITTASPLAAATVGVSYSAQFAASGGTGSYTWSGASLPTWLTISSSGLLSGTPPSAGPVSFTVIVVDSASNRTSSTFTLPVNSMVTINTTSPLGAGTVGATYSQQFVASGGSGVYTWNGSSLPAWLTLSSSGLLSGTPPSAGTVTFVATVTDSLQQSARGTFSFTVNSAVTINTVSPLAPATLGSAYSVQFTASGGTMIYNWTATSLPTGFALSSSGLLTGTPTTAGPLSFGIVVTDSLNNSASGTFSLPVNAVLTITNTNPLPSAVLNAVYSLQFRASGGSGGYTWSAGTFSHWLTLSATGFLTGVPPNSSAVTFAVTVTDSQGHTATGNFTVNVSSPISILTTSPLPVATAGFPYQSQFAASGGSGAYLWSAGGLPLGLSLTSYGLLFGSPVAGGNAVFTVTVQDANNSTNGTTQTFTLPITVPAPPAITTASPLAPGTVNVPYAQQFSGIGGSGNYTWSASGLPAGFGFTSAGLLSGTPSAAGTYSFNVSLVDNQTAQTVTQGFTLTVSTALTITTLSPLPAAVVGQAYSVQLSAVGGATPYTWSGSGLPPGLSLNGGGLVSGIPTAAGTVNFTATVSDIGGRRAARSFAIQVNAPLTITTVSPLPSAVVNLPYSATLNATGGVGAYTWTGAGLPVWASLSTAGVVSGTPPQPGAFTIGATVTDATNISVSRQFTLLVASGTPLSFVSTTLTPCVVAVSCGTSLAGIGGTPPYTFTLAGAPSGGTVTVAPNGQVTGTFPAAGSFTVPVQLTDAAQGSITRTLTVQVVAPLVVTAPSTVTITSGTTYTLTPSTSQGAPPYTYSISAGMLPPGLTLSNTGVISGTPTATGTFTFTIQVVDGTGTTVQTTVTVVVNAPTLSIMTPGTLPSGTAGTAYSQTFQAANGNGSLAWMLTGGSLPPGLSLSPSGTLTGTPTQAGDFSFTLQVTDSSGASTTQSFQLRIAAPAQIPAVTASLSATVTAGDQPMVTITLGAPYPLPILVTATLQLTPNPGNNTDLVFANGMRTTQFTIPANSTQATLPFQAGTLAGTIQIGFTLQSAGVDVTPNPAPSVTTQIPATAPVLKSVSATLISGGFQLTIVGVSSPRDMKTVAIHFTAATGATLQSTYASLDVSAAFAQWYQNPSSLITGSQFSLTIPVTVSGDVASIASVSVVMTNSVGASSAASATIH